MVRISTPKESANDLRIIQWSSGPSSESLPLSSPRKLGRPRKHVANIIAGPKRPVGRPRKEIIGEVIAKRRPGRPPKATLPGGGVVLNFVKHRFKIPGNQQAGSTPIHPFFLRQELSQNNVDTAPLVQEPEPRAQTNNIIPLDDPNEGVRIPDDEEYEDIADSGVGEGIGEEDGFDEEDEGEMDEVDPGMMDGDGVDRSKPLPSVKRCPLPTWLQQAFTRCLAQLEKRNKDGVPLLYANHRTFWFPQESPYLSMKAGNVSPSALYNVRFFGWDPKGLVPNLPCPYCRRKLDRHSALKRPRRCIDLDTTVYLIGFRYRCISCPKSPKPNQTTITFRSWDSRILDILPPSLAAEFPAKLTHRSALSKSLCAWLQSSILNGIGAKQFTDALRSQHLLRHDELHLQYLDFISYEYSSNRLIAGKTFAPFLHFTDRSKDGFHGYIPSALYLREAFDAEIHLHILDIHQFVGLLRGGILSIDHSHKVTKHIALFHGERVFIGLLSVTNEDGCLRICNFVASKSHAQMEPALREFCNSLALFGHLQPPLIYTDNMSDKSFLEGIFASLRVGIEPVEKYSHLPVYTLPADIQIDVRNSEQAINGALLPILSDIPLDNDDGDIVVGFDCEWNFRQDDAGNVIERGDISVIQIAYKKRVLLIQVSEFLARRRLPRNLVTLLQNPRILKTGRMVSSDVKQLEAIVKPSAPFKGALDLASYAKARLVVPKANVSLSDICARTFHRCLRKNVPERNGSDWENPLLTPAQKIYAATDAYVSLALYHQLSHFSIPKPLNTSRDPIGTPVLVYHTDNTVVIARGRLASPPLATSCADHVLIPRRTVAIEVLEVLVPGAIVSSHNKKALKDFGSPPFHLVSSASHVYGYDPQVFGLHTTLESINSTARPEFEPPRQLPTDVSVSDTNTSNGTQDSDPNDDNVEGMGDIVRSDMQAEGDSNDISDNDTAEFRRLSSRVNQDSRTFGTQELTGIPRPDPRWDGRLYSRVLKDPFHMFNMIKLPMKHGLRKDFARAFRDTVFIPNQEDKMRISSWAANLSPPRTFANLVLSRPSWVWKRCRRIIPPPSVLFPLVEKLFHTYGPLADAKTGVPLFNDSNWKIAKNILDLIYQGYVSDPPGIPLYTITCLDSQASNLPIYRCARGTNFVEGGVHTHLRSRLPTNGVSLKHVNSCLLGFVLMRNLRVGTLNTTGKQYLSHPAIWLINKLQTRLSALADLFTHPIPMTNWVNGSLYIQTNEQLGILPVPKALQVACGMREFNTAPIADDVESLSQSDPNLKKSYRYLAQMQGTRKPILPVHTHQEKDLFRDLVEHSMFFNSVSRGPRWQLAAKEWNAQHADVKADIFYKLPEELEAYYKEWLEQINVRDTLARTRNRRRPILDAARDPERSELAPNEPAQPLPGFKPIIQGFDMRESHPPPPITFRGTQGYNGPSLYGPGFNAMPQSAIQPPASLPLPQFAPQPRPPPPPLPQLPPQILHNLLSCEPYQYRPSPYPSFQQTGIPESTPVNYPLQTTPSNPSYAATIAALSRQQVAANLVPSIIQDTGSRPRKSRTCMKCGSTFCAGSQNRKYCTKPCRDCKNVACKGRDSSCPQKPCWEAKKKHLLAVPTAPNND